MVVVRGDRVKGGHRWWVKHGGRWWSGNCNGWYQEKDSGRRCGGGEGRGGGGVRAVVVSPGAVVTFLSPQLPALP